MKLSTLSLCLLLSLAPVTPVAAQHVAPDIPAAERACLAGFEGVYRFADGTELFVDFLPEVQQLLMTEYPSGKARILFPDPAGGFSTGPTIGSPSPVAQRISIRSGRLRLEADGKVRIAEIERLRREPVRFESAGASLSGTLTLPRGPGPHPAVVFIHGGGAQTRDFLWVADFFARRGVAVLAYDKRGSGQSGGDWRTAGPTLLARDALAAVELLRGRSDIDPDRIGLYGSSNGGWVAPRAIELAPDRIAFLVVRSGPGLPERENLIFEVESDLRAAGLSEDVVRRVRALHEQDIAVIRSHGQGWNEFRAALIEASSEPWFGLTRLPPNLIEMNEANRERIEAYIADQLADVVEPARVWRAVRVPVLYQVGGADRYVDGRQALGVVSEALRAAGNADATLRLYPTGDHPMFDNPAGYTSGILGAQGYAPGYMTDLDLWIATHVAPAPRSAR